MAPGLPTPQPDNNATAIYYAATPSTFTIYISNTGGMTYRDPNDHKPTYSELRMFQSIGQYLDDSYAELLRLLNYDPSINGVKTKKERFNQLMTQVRSLWVRHVRFDLRQPCWRAGRWKSLTA